MTVPVTLGRRPTPSADERPATGGGETGARTGRTGRAPARVFLICRGRTGVIIALQRSAGTRLGALVLAAVAAPLGVWLAGRARHATSDGGGARAFLAGALCWTAVSAAFYGGWVVGPTPSDAPHSTILAHALDAVRATAYSSVLSATLLAALVRVTRGGTNHFGVCTFALFWAVHELAKLNVFLGVVNPGTQFLPEYLLYLRRYFGPAENSPLLVPSVVALLALTAWLGWRAWRAPVPARRLGAALLGAVALLAAFEHAVLGAPSQLGWWDVFLTLRGSR